MASHALTSDRFAERVGLSARRFVASLGLDGEEELVLRRVLINLTWAAGDTEDQARLDTFLPPWLPGPTQAARLDLAAAIRTGWAMGRLEQEDVEVEEVDRNAIDQWPSSADPGLQGQSQQRMEGF